MSDFSGTDRIKHLMLNGQRWILPCVRGFFLACLGIFILSNVAAAQSVSPCGERNEIISALNNRYAEKPVATGLTQGGGVIEIFASGTGSWTMIITLPTGRACFMAAGENWESLSQMAKGTQISF